MNRASALAATAVLGAALISCGQEKKEGATGHEGHEHPHAAPAADKATSQSYTCPMHPEVVTNAPGECPKCGMQLVLKG